MSCRVVCCLFGLQMDGPGSSSSDEDSDDAPSGDDDDDFGLEESEDEGPKKTKKGGAKGKAAGSPKGRKQAAAAVAEPGAAGKVRHCPPAFGCLATQHGLVNSPDPKKLQQMR